MMNDLKQLHPIKMPEEKIKDIINIGKSYIYQYLITKEMP